MKKILLTILTLLTVSLIANEEDKSFSYSGIGAGVNLMFPIPVPGVCVGLRDRTHNTAIDGRINISSICLISAIELDLQALTYSKDNSYVGGGIGGGLSFGQGNTILSAYPMMTVGKEKEKAFQEFSFSIVSFSTIGVIVSPCVNYTYGFKF